MHYLWFNNMQLRCVWKAEKVKFWSIDMKKMDLSHFKKKEMSRMNTRLWEMSIELH